MREILLHEPRMIDLDELLESETERDKEIKSFCFELLQGFKNKTGESWESIYNDLIYRLEEYENYLVTEKYSYRDDVDLDEYRDNIGNYTSYVRLGSAGELLK